MSWCVFGGFIWVADADIGIDLNYEIKMSKNPAVNSKYSEGVIYVAFFYLI